MAGSFIACNTFHSRLKIA